MSTLDEVDSCPTLLAGTSFVASKDRDSAARDIACTTSGIAIGVTGEDKRGNKLFTVIGAEVTIGKAAIGFPDNDGVPNDGSWGPVAIATSVFLRSRRRCPAHAS